MPRLLNHTLPVLFQWAGGKSKMLKHYIPLLPDDAGRRPYVEPFAGGAALFSHLSKNADRNHPVSATLNDINSELITLFASIKTNPETFIEQVLQYSDLWAQTSADARKPLYYSWRQAYWQMPLDTTSSPLLYSLMRTSFNGIWQTCVQSKGRFATPAGLMNKPGGFLHPQAIMDWSAALTHTTLLSGSYDALAPAQNSFIFCDPPYRASFTDYGSGFTDADQRALIAWCRKMHAETGSTVWLANRDNNDGFFDTHAPDAIQHRFPITYTAGRRKNTADGFKAKPAVELLLIWP